MEDEENNNNTPAVSVETNTQLEENRVTGACIDRQPDTVLRQAGWKQTGGRGSRSNPGAPAAATGIRVLKAGHRASFHTVCGFLVARGVVEEEIQCLMLFHD